MYCSLKRFLVLWRDDRHRPANNRFFLLYFLYTFVLLAGDSVRARFYSCDTDDSATRRHGEYKFCQISVLIQTYLRRFFYVRQTYRPHNPSTEKPTAPPGCQFVSLRPSIAYVDRCRAQLSFHSAVHNCLFLVVRLFRVHRDRIVTIVYGVCVAFKLRHPSKVFLFVNYLVFQLV